MIDEIHIKDVALIAEATFAPGANLTVVTGETGSGKTALLGAIKLLAGERADAGMVREGADELVAEGRFFLDDEDPDGLIVCRRVGANGRSRASIDGSLASIKELAARVGSSIELCGQHEHQRLLAPAYQRAALDAWGAAEIAGPLEGYRSALADAKAAQVELDRLEALADADAVELDRARFALEQIDAVSPLKGEYENLMDQLPRLENAELLQDQAREAHDALAVSGGALERVDAALSAVERIAGIDTTLESQAQAVRDAYFSLEDVARELASYRDRVDFPREELEASQARLSELQGLMRGFGPRMDDVFALAERSRAQLAEYDDRDELVVAARAARDTAEKTLSQAADALCAARASVAPRFLDAVEAQMARLEMGGVHLEIQVTDLPREEWGPQGPQSIEFMFAAGSQVRPQRLGRIASGGELSRVALALNVALGDVDDVDTLVFDEIDAGTGGQTARALGLVLEDLAQTHQVIVVTHLPQVAVHGSVHYRVTKADGDIPETILTRLEGQQRVDEIARMLSGEVTETSCAHARELLSEQDGAESSSSTASSRRV